MDSIDQMAESFKTLKELREYSKSQFILINELNKKINNLEAENKHLKSLVEKAAPILAESEGKLEMYNDISDEMAICLMQIKVLKDKSISGELSFEETKKMEIYTKLLLSLKSGLKKTENPAKALTDEELLSLIDQES